MAGSEHSVLLTTICVMLGFLACAVLIEIFRRRREQQRRLSAAWTNTEEIIREKDLSQEEQNLLRQLILRHAPKSPLRMVTVRQQFDTSIEHEIEQFAANHSTAELEKYGQMLRDIRERLSLDYIPFGQRIHSTRELYRGQMIWIADKSDTNIRWRRMEVTALDEAFFRLASREPGPIPPMSVGETISCRMWREEDARYVFTARLAEIYSEPQEWAVRHCNQLQRTQSRAHFRIRYEQSSDIGIVNAPVDGDMADVASRAVVTRIRGRFTSLSGGGFAVVVDQPVPKQVLLRVKINMDSDLDPVETTARVVNVAQVSAGRHLVRAAFVGISDVVRDRITHYVFRQQQPIKAAENEANQRTE